MGCVLLSGLDVASVIGSLLKVIMKYKFLFKLNELKTWLTICLIRYTAALNTNV